LPNGAAALVLGELRLFVLGRSTACLWGAALSTRSSYVSFIGIRTAAAVTAVA